MIKQQQELHADLAMCQNPPINLTEVRTCKKEWIAWINSYSNQISDRVHIKNFVGGGGGGGASYILPVTREGEGVNDLPIVIAPGGGGSAAVERHDLFNDILRPSSDIILTDEEQHFFNQCSNCLTSFYPGRYGRRITRVH